MGRLRTDYIAVANYIVEQIDKYNEVRNSQERIIMSIQRLQKLLYFCDIEDMKRHDGKPLFEEEFNAWPEGPAIPNLYNLFEHYSSGRLGLNWRKATPEPIDDDIKSVIDDVLNATQDLDREDLIQLSKITDGPWHNVYRDDDKGHTQIISKEEMYDFYLTKQLFEIPTRKELNYQQQDFKISRNNYAIVIEKDNQRFSITQSNDDDDIWFSTWQKGINIELSLSSRNYAEWQTYIVFEYLMKSMVGRYMLNNDNKNEYSRLPKDFINLENKVIIWHSDSGMDNVLKLEYTDEKIIKISMTKCKDSQEYDTNSVRIRTSGSEYQYYYQEFLEFFRHLVLLEQRLNKTVENVQQDKKEESKKLSLFKRFNKKK
jgi:uncharacterized phage-associated protein